MKRIIEYILLSVMFIVVSSINLDAKIHTPDHYEQAIRQCFREDRWEAGKYMLDEARPYYGELSPFRELDGWYCYHTKDYNKARYYLTLSLREDSSNTHARELIELVEEATLNYSSAICYINELLENNAYSTGLWRRKIYLYREQKNEVEADRLLLRMYQIFPNDSTVRKDVAYHYEESLIKQKKDNDLAGQIKSSRELTNLDPTNADNYLILTSLLLRQGNTAEACEVSGTGAAITGNIDLIKKHASILCDQGKHYEAAAYIAELKREMKNPELERIHSAILEEQARYANANDPYTAYGRVYEKTHSSESFNYLINTSISRGYYNDALYYIKDYKKNKPEDENILYKEYVIYSQLGNEIQAANALYKLHLISPDDKDITEELSAIYYKRGIEAMSLEEYVDAIKPLEFVAENATDEEMKASAESRLLSCFDALKRYDEALSSLNPSDSLFALKKADLLVKKGEYKDALVMIKEAGDSTLYGEVAVGYIKRLMEHRKYKEALVAVDTALTYSHDKELYMYGISAASITGKDNSRYIDEGFKEYPYEDYFTNQFAGLSIARASKLRKDKDYEGAMTIIDTALVYSPADKELLYTKGLIYGDMHQYDSAYVYQKNYNPSPTETFLYNKKMQGLLAKGKKNIITIDYQRARLGTEDVVTANAGINYARKINEKNTVSIMMNYAGRDDATDEENLRTQQTPGGIGIQVGAGWERSWDKGWNTSVSGAWSNKYFPKISAKVSVSKELKNDWLVEGHVQYRKIDSYSKVGVPTSDGGMKFDHWDHTQPNMWSAGVYANKTLENGFDFNVGVDGFLVNNKTYFSANGKIQYSPFDGNTSRVYATGGFGTAPEITLIDNSMPNSFEKINTFVGAGGVYTLTSDIDIGLEGTWHTMYKQNQIMGQSITETTSYVNLFYVHATLILKF